MTRTGPGSSGEAEARARGDTKSKGFGEPMASRDKRYFCPHCGQPIEPGRLGGATTKWDVLKIAVVFVGLVAVVLAYRWG
jgi:hypothetical protein